MEMNNPYSTHVALASFDRVLTDLINKGYKQQFRKEPNCLYCVEINQWIIPKLFSVDESYFFNDPSNPDGDRLLYAISTSSGIKGILVDTWGVYADNMSWEMRQKLGATNKMKFTIT